MSDPAGLVGGRYRLVRTIGRGGMGTVWQAHDEVLGRDVAVKELRPPHNLSGPERAEFAARTLREARAAGRVAHPGVAAVYDVLEENGHPWIVMEFVPSRTLGARIREDGPLPPAEAAWIGLRLLEALNAAHAAGVLHRDVKPDNVLLTDDGRTVLTDFGIATTEDDASITSTGILVGTPAFIAPERAAGGAARPAADLWSLGVTLHVAVEGHSPFRRPHALATLGAVLHDPPAPLFRAGPLAPVILGLLEKNPANRMTAEETAHRLHAITTIQPPEPTAPLTSPAATGRSRRVDRLGGAAGSTARTGDPGNTPGGAGGVGAADADATRPTDVGAAEASRRAAADAAGAPPPAGMDAAGAPPLAGAEAGSGVDAGSGVGAGATGASHSSAAGAPPPARADATGAPPPARADAARASAAGAGISAGATGASRSRGTSAAGAPPPAGTRAAGAGAAGAGTTGAGAAEAGAAEAGAAAARVGSVRARAEPSPRRRTWGAGRVSLMAGGLVAVALAAGGWAWLSGRETTPSAPVTPVVQSTPSQSAPPSASSAPSVPPSTPSPAASAEPSVRPGTPGPTPTRQPNPTKTKPKPTRTPSPTRSATKTDDQRPGTVEPSGEQGAKDDSEQSEDNTGSKETA
ncbi:serine/threonine-protein kinase [Nonomuraea typhae]|uniref:non-specific serine/threonine protein kinase n=1 Tax=Nonomuraea typhae TaxID=2603600 RepID=A0ABW7YQI8_9ACTN